METTKKTAYEIMMEQYENAADSSNKSKGGFDKKAYFGTFLEPGTTSATKLVRILPDANGGTPFTEVYGHSIQIEGSWRTMICPKHEDGTPCPFCEAKDILFQSGVESDRKLGGKYYAKKMFVAKVIDRNAPNEGPKFWRFNFNLNKEGIHDKIMAIIKHTGTDITDAATGRDLTVDISKGSQKLSVNLLAGDPSALSADAEQVNAWLSDARTWRDVYNVKPYEYLAILVAGKTPTYDKENEKFVAKEDTDDNTEEASQVASALNVTAAPTEAAPIATPVAETVQAAPVAAPVAENTQAAPVATETASATDEDDLPF